jgi:hypothetical protein
MTVRWCGFTHLYGCGGAALVDNEVGPLVGLSLLGFRSAFTPGMA